MSTATKPLNSARCIGYWLYFFRVSIAWVAINSRLKEEADILFLLTTNRPEALEAALAARPGRIDHAIEFPLPDEEGRATLVRLYSQGVSVSEDGITEITKRTEGVSASFIKELMRRIVQFHIEADGTGNVTHTDIDNALDEMLFKGGMLNLKLLGAKTE